MKEPQALVFGYGSLLAPHSIARTIPEFPERNHLLRPVLVRGWQRTWTAVYKNNKLLSDKNGVTPAGIAYMNVEPGKQATALGVVFPADLDDLAALDRREKLYDRIDVSRSAKFLVEDVPDWWRELPVITYTATHPWRAGGELPSIGIRADYRSLIHDAGVVLDRQWDLGDRFEKDFVRVNESFPDFDDVVPPEDARYTRG